jgi:hypothetical protein
MYYTKISTIRRHESRENEGVYGKIAGSECWKQFEMQIITGVSKLHSIHHWHHQKNKYMNKAKNKSEQRSSDRNHESTELQMAQM